MDISITLSIFGTLISFIVALIAYQFNGIRSDLKDLNESVKNLNISVARIIRDQNWHKEELTEIKNRLYSLEKGRLK